MDFHQNFRKYLPQEDPELIRVFKGICHAALSRFLVLEVCVPEPKPFYDFLTNFQGMFTLGGSRAD